MLTRMLARLLGLGSLALLAAAPVSAQVPPEPGIAFSREFGPGWLSIVVAHPDGGFVVAGRRFTQEEGTGRVDGQHPLVIRLGPDGRVKWEKAFDARHGGEPHAVEITPGAGVMVTGFAGRSVEKAAIRRLDWIAEIDDEGRVTRDDGVTLDRPRHEGKFIPIGASGFAFYGSANIETGTPGVDIFATDARGSLLWQATMPDVAGDCEGAATADADGNLVAVFGTASPSFRPDGARFRRFDARGRLTLDAPFSAYKDTCPLTIARVPGAGFVVTGYRSEGDGPTGWIALLDGDGALAWERLFGPAGTSLTAGYQAASAPDGSLAVSGCTDGAAPEGLVLRYSRIGDLTGERRFASEGGVNPVAVQAGRDGSIVLAGVLGQRCGLISGQNSGGTAWVTAVAPSGLQAPTR